jgi:pimeloyl-ACP methyl ester carboxylesterase
MLRALIVAAAVTLASCTDASTGVLPRSTIALAACHVDGVEARALCGSHQVWENPDSKAGRRIPLHLVIIPARNADHRQEDPVFYFDGGPGSSAIGAAGWVARLLRDVNEIRDLVFVDVRGTGRSSALDCALPSDDEPVQAYFEEFLSDRYVRDCLARQSADVRFYTQPIAVDDVDEVRAALGYQRINLFGTSGGTRQAQLYMRRHGGSVRAVLLQGAAPMDAEMPLAFARAMEAGLRALFDGCTSDAACREAHPALEQAWQRAMQRFDGRAVRARVRHPRTRREEDVTIARGVFADGVRHLLYNLQSGRRVAALIESAGRGDFVPFAEAELEQALQFGRGIAHGFFLSSTCAEDVRFIDEDDIRRDTSDTWFGDYRVRRQQAACRIWPRGEGIGDDFQQPVQSDLPVLVISGDADVATPASGAERVVRHLPNAVHVIFRGQGHVPRDPACTARLMADFFASGNAKGLDISCAETQPHSAPGMQH